MANTLRQLQKLGQSVWLDDLRREFFVDGTLARLIDQDGISGVTSNPAIFERAIADTNMDDAEIEAYARTGIDAQGIYEQLIVADIRRAADLLEPIYRETGAVDGYVSLEVSPHIANDTCATIDEGRRLWDLVKRRNLMIKVPGTLAGLPAIRALIKDGININVTLLFSPVRYRQVIEEFCAGLDDRRVAGQSLEQVASVASFFVSRIDTAVDQALDKSPARMSAPVRGTVAIATASRAYQVYRSSLNTPRWQELAAVGAQPQRLLWASTGTKDPDYSDVKYVESLIAAGTVNTMPLKTLLAYRDHGDPQLRMRQVVEQSGTSDRQLQPAGIDMEAIFEQLEQEGVRKFVEPFDRLLSRIDAARRQGQAAVSEEK